MNEQSGRNLVTEGVKERCLHFEKVHEGFVEAYFGDTILKIIWNKYPSSTNILSIHDLLHILEGYSVPEHHFERKQDKLARRKVTSSPKDSDSQDSMYETVTRGVSYDDFDISLSPTNLLATSYDSASDISPTAVRLLKSNLRNPVLARRNYNIDMMISAANIRPAHGGNKGFSTGNQTSVSLAKNEAARQPPATTSSNGATSFLSIGLVSSVSSGCSHTSDRGLTDSYGSVPIGGLHSGATSTGRLCSKYADRPPEVPVAAGRSGQAPPLAPCSDPALKHGHDTENTREGPLNEYKRPVFQSPVDTDIVMSENSGGNCNIIMPPLSGLSISPAERTNPDTAPSTGRGAPQKLSNGLSAPILPVIMEGQGVADDHSLATVQSRSRSSSRSSTSNPFCSRGLLSPNEIKRRHIEDLLQLRKTIIEEFTI